MSKGHVLLIDDSEETQVLVRRSLEPRIEVVWSKTARDADDELRRNRYDLIILDVDLPDADGFQLCAKLRENEDLPILLLTGKSTVGEKTLGFAAGADDYICKPFDLAELRIRVQARLRRHAEASAVNEVLRLESLKIDLARQKAYRIKGGVEVEMPLSALEFRLLSFLAARPERVFSRDQLLDAVWGASSEVNDRTVDKRVSALRKKLGPLGSRLETVAGSGYRIAGQKAKG